MAEELHYNWTKFIAEADEMFDEMIKCYDNMFDGDLIVKHFYVRYAFMEVMYDYCERIMSEHGEAIQKELIPWIKAEHASGRLFNKDNWRPFRDEHLFTQMFIGYRRIFDYKGYLFQLSMDFGCPICRKPELCKYCKMDENPFHFELAFCGYADDRDPNISPAATLYTTSDGYMDQKMWYEKR